MNAKGYGQPMGTGLDWDRTGPGPGRGFPTIIVMVVVVKHRPESPGFPRTMGRVGQDTTTTIIYQPLSSGAPGSTSHAEATTTAASNAAHGVSWPERPIPGKQAINFVSNHTHTRCISGPCLGQSGLWGVIIPGNHLHHRMTNRSEQNVQRRLINVLLCRTPTYSVDCL